VHPFALSEGNRPHHGLFDFFISSARFPPFSSSFLSLVFTHGMKLSLPPSLRAPNTDHATCVAHRFLPVTAVPWLLFVPGIARFNPFAVLLPGFARRLFQSSGLFLFLTGTRQYSPDTPLMSHGNPSFFLGLLHLSFSSSYVVFIYLTTTKMRDSAALWSAAPIPPNSARLALSPLAFPACFFTTDPHSQTRNFPVRAAQPGPIVHLIPPPKPPSCTSPDSTRH